LNNVLEGLIVDSHDFNNNTNVSTEKNLQKPFLFYVNPKAGAKKAEKIFYKQILPVLTEANTPFELVITSK